MPAYSRPPTTARRRPARLRVPRTPTPQHWQAATHLRRLHDGLSGRSPHGAARRRAFAAQLHPRWIGGFTEQ